MRNFGLSIAAAMLVTFMSYSVADAGDRYGRYYEPISRHHDQHHIHPSKVLHLNQNIKPGGKFRYSLDHVGYYNRPPDIHRMYGHPHHYRSRNLFGGRAYHGSSYLPVNIYQTSDFERLTFTPAVPSLNDLSATTGISAAPVSRPALYVVNDVRKLKIIQNENRVQTNDQSGPRIVNVTAPKG